MSQRVSPTRRVDNLHNKLLCNGLISTVNASVLMHIENTKRYLYYIYSTLCNLFIQKNFGGALQVVATQVVATVPVDSRIAGRRRLPIQRLLLTLAIGVMAIGLVACGARNEPDPTATPDTAATADAQKNGAVELEVSPIGGSAGTPIEVSGSGWEPGTMVVINLQDEDGESGILAATVADKDGKIVTDFKYPSNQRWNKPSVYTVRAADRTEEQNNAETQFAVIQSDGDGSTASSGAATSGDADAAQSGGKLVGAAPANTATYTPPPTNTPTYTPPPTNTPTYTPPPTNTPTYTPPPTNTPTYTPPPTNTPTYTPPPTYTSQPTYTPQPTYTVQAAGSQSPAGPQAPAAGSQAPAAGAQAPAAGSQAPAAGAQSPAGEQAPTYTPLPTYTALPTYTPLPTYTALPTFTPEPPPKAQSPAGPQAPAAGEQAPAAGQQAPAAGEQAPAAGQQAPGGSQASAAGAQAPVEAPTSTPTNTATYTPPPTNTPTVTPPPTNTPTYTPPPTNTPTSTPPPTNTPEPPPKAQSPAGAQAPAAGQQSPSGAQSPTDTPVAPLKAQSATNTPVPPLKAQSATNTPEPPLKAQSVTNTPAPAVDAVQAPTETTAPPAKVATAAATASSLSRNGVRVWRGNYWTNQTLDGPATLIRRDETIDFDWGDGGPDPAFGPDGFSVRWTNTIDIETAGTYRFVIEVDDGARFFVDDELLLDNWRTGSQRTINVDTELTAGEHDITFEYFEDVGKAVAKLGWMRLVDPASASAPPTGAWLGEYFDNDELAGVPIIVRNEAAINFNWNTDSPGAGIPSDNFSARWQRKVNFDEGVYRFEVEIDDGMRVWVGEDLVIDQWQDNRAATYTAEVNLPAGEQVVRVEYFENTLGARAILSWSQINKTLIAPTPTWTPESNQDAATYSLTKRVAAGSDDAEQRANGDVSLGSDELEMTQSETEHGQQLIGLRFVDVTIPQGATVTDAYIEFTTEFATQEGTSLIFYGEAAANAQTFAESSANISSRDRTDANVSWLDIPAWTAIGAVHRTPDLNAIINEVVGQDDWVGGSAIAFIVTGAGQRIAESYDGDAAAAANLVVEYSIP